MIEREPLTLLSLYLNFWLCSLITEQSCDQWKKCFSLLCVIKGHRWYVTEMVYFQTPKSIHRSGKDSVMWYHKGFTWAEGVLICRLKPVLCPLSPPLGPTELLILWISLVLCRCYYNFAADWWNKITVRPKEMPSFTLYYDGRQLAPYITGHNSCEKALSLKILIKLSYHGDPGNTSLTHFRP